jgi:hypothetical protein
MTIGSYEDTYIPGSGTQTIVAGLTARRISWGAIFAGVVMVLAVQVILSLLGIGIGFSTVDLTQNGSTPSATSLGIGAGLWWGVSYLIALLIGGYVAAVLAANPAGLNGILHGLLTWAFALLVTVFLLSTAVGSMIGGAFSAVGSTLSAAGQTVKEAVPQIAQTAGITPDVVQQKAKDLLSAQPTNADPRAMSAEQAQQEIAANLPKLVTGDDQAKQAARARITAIVAAQANISPEAASQRLDKLQTQATETKDQTVDKAKQVADKAASGLSRASLMAFVALLLGAGAAAIGGHLGARRVVSDDVSAGNEGVVLSAQKDRPGTIPGRLRETRPNVDRAAAGDKPSKT